MKNKENCKLYNKTNVGADASVCLKTIKTNRIGVVADASVRPNLTKTTQKNVGAGLDLPGSVKTDPYKIHAITLVSLVITVIILIILAGVSLNLTLGQNGIFTKSKEAVNKYIDVAQKEQEHLDDTYRELEGINSKEYNLDEGVNKPKLTEGMIPIKYDESKSNWVICEESDKDWYNYKKGKKWANVMLSDGKYTSKEPAENGKTKATVGAEVEEKDLGSMFVWIPRYAYSIVKYKQQVDSGEGTQQDITDVTFLVGTTNKDINANTYQTDYDVDEVKGNTTPKIVHPAFTFGGEKLTGIWVAKFEASMKEENKNTYTDNNVTNKTIKVVPNADTWRYINVGNAFLNCYNMSIESNKYGLTTSADAHLTKNTEWGATAYLSASQYGVTPKTNNSNTKYTEQEGEKQVDKYHSYSANKDYKTNTNQSTTGNVTGIYDLNGGAWEYVAAYWDNGNSNLSSNGTSEVFPSNSLDSKYTKYWVKYEVSEKEIQLANVNTSWNSVQDENKERIEITKDRYERMKSKKGDAMYEVINTYSYYGKNDSNKYEWRINNGTEDKAGKGTSYYNSDLALIGNTLIPFLLRGGNWFDGISAGVFDSNGSYGIANFDSRFPPSYSCKIKR